VTETLIMTEKADRTSLIITFVFQVLTAILEALSSFVSGECFTTGLPGPVRLSVSTSCPLFITALV